MCLVEGRGVGQIARLFESRDRRCDGVGPGRDDDARRPDLSHPLHFQSIRGEKPCTAEVHASPQSPEALRVVVVSDGFTGSAHPVHDFAERVLRRGAPEPETVRMSHEVGGARGGDKRLRRNTASPQAVPSQGFSLDDRCSSAEVGCSRRRD
jgi:hypothetical protein